MKQILPPPPARRGGRLAACLVVAGCTSTSVDPRSSIVAPPRLVGELARSVNGSELWQAYFEQMAPSPAVAQPLVEVRLDMERHTRESVGGDYDPGTVQIDFKVAVINNSCN